MNKKLYRDEHNKVFGGVCSGLAEYFDMDVTVVRLLFAFTFFTMGVSFVPYIVLWIVLPVKGYNYPGVNNPFVDYTVPNQQTSGTENKYGPFSSVNMPPRRKSNAGVVFGTALIITGAIALANEYDIIPYFEWHRLWPVIIIIAGGALIASGLQKNPWEKQNWQMPGKTENNNTQATDNSAAV